MPNYFSYVVIVFLNKKKAKKLYKCTQVFVCLPHLKDCLFGPQNVQKLKFNFSLQGKSG